MSAVTPHLEEQNDPTETEEERILTTQVRPYHGRGGANLPVAEVFSGDHLTAEVLSQTHSELMQMAWLRKAVTDALQGRSFHVQAGNRTGADKRHVYLILDGPIIPGAATGQVVAAWNPAASPTASQYRLTSWTSKMGSPSFSLPAGPAESGGACPGAAAGQSIVPRNALVAAARRVQTVTGRPVRLPEAICQYCYAQGGQYSTGGVQFAQVLRYAWTRIALANGTFVPTMIYAVQNANYKLEGGKAGDDAKTALHYLPERHPGRYFRMHDSGDFISKGYLAAWKQVANALPDVTFWAPTRCWATSWGIDAVNQINNPPRNLIIRPSAFHINEPPPQNLGPGWARGTTVYAPDNKPEAQARGDYQWDCQAYAVPDTKATCRNSMGADGQTGCRACWRYGQDAAINYTIH